MNVTLYATIEASELKPGTVLLDVPDYDPTHPEIGVAPTAYLVDEIADRLDGRTVYGRPVWRTEGKRRRWSFKPDDDVTVELDPADALRLLGEIRSQYVGVFAVVVAGGRSLDSLQEAASDG